VTYLKTIFKLAFCYSYAFIKFDRKLFVNTSPPQ
jgi:hypothetical protein